MKVTVTTRVIASNRRLRVQCGWHFVILYLNRWRSWNAYYSTQVECRKALWSWSRISLLGTGKGWPWQPCIPPWVAGTAAYLHTTFRLGTQFIDPSPWQWCTAHCISAWVWTMTGVILLCVFEDHKFSVLCHCLSSEWTSVCENVSRSSYSETVY